MLSRSHHSHPRPRRLRRVALTTLILVLAVCVGNVVHMSRDCCRGRQCVQWSVSPSLTSTPLCSPTSEPFVDAKWSLEMPPFVSPVPCSVKKKIRDPVKKKVIVPPLRKPGGQHYVDAMKFNPTYLSEHMALSIPISKCSTQHTVCSPISPYSMEMPSYDHNDDCMDCVTEADGKLQEAEKEDTLILENEDVLNTTVSSACNYVKPKKKRGERLTKEAVSGSSAVLFALKHKVQSLQ